MNAVTILLALAVSLVLVGVAGLLYLPPRKAEPEEAWDWPEDEAVPYEQDADWWRQGKD
jgi:predicted small lipoprotein YifL